MFLRQFGKYMPLECDLHIVISQYLPSRGECVLHLFMCLWVLFPARAPDCDVDAVFGRWVYIFGHGLQFVSVFRHARKLSVES